MDHYPILSATGGRFAIIVRWSRTEVKPRIGEPSAALARTQEESHPQRCGDEDAAKWRANQNACLDDG